MKTLLPALLHPGKVLFVEAHAPAEERRDGRFGEIVARWTEAAGGDDGARAIERLANGGRDVLCHVADGGSSPDAYADRSQLARQVGGIRVDGESEEELVAYGDELNIHGGRASWLEEAGI
jgi:hypothetical protein